MTETVTKTTAPPAALTVANIDVVDPASSDRRRNWGLAFLAGGGVAMTAFASVAMWMIYERRGPLEYVFYLGLAAMALVAVVLTGFAGLLVKRTLRLSKDGLEVTDQVVPGGT